MIMKQIDAEDLGLPASEFFAFVESEDVYRGRGALVEWTEHRYSVAIYRRPAKGQSPAVAHCKHKHVGLDAAYLCARKILRQQINKKPA
jgi:hypothetical protein